MDSARSVESLDIVKREEMKASRRRYILSRYSRDLVMRHRSRASNTTVQDLKLPIEWNHIDLLNLFYNGKYLNDSPTLDISQHSTLECQLGLNISVRTMSGKTVFVELASSNTTITVGSLLAQIQDKEGVPKFQQWLFFDGRPLDNNCTLTDCNIRHDISLPSFYLAGSAADYFHCSMTDYLDIVRDKMKTLGGVVKEMKAELWLLTIFERSCMHKHLHHFCMPEFMLDIPIREYLNDNRTLKSLTSLELKISLSEWIHGDKGEHLNDNRTLESLNILKLMIQSGKGYLNDDITQFHDRLLYKQISFTGEQLLNNNCTLIDYIHRVISLSSFSLAGSADDSFHRLMDISGSAADSVHLLKDKKKTFIAMPKEMKAELRLAIFRPSDGIRKLKMLNLSNLVPSREYLYDNLTVKSFNIQNLASMGLLKYLPKLVYNVVYLNDNRTLYPDNISWLSARWLGLRVSVRNMSGKTASVKLASSNTTIGNLKDKEMKSSLGRNILSRYWRDILPKIEIYITTRPGNAISLVADTSDTIRDLKLKIPPSEWNHTDLPDLFYNGVYLKDNRTLGSYDILWDSLSVGRRYPSGP